MFEELKYSSEKNNLDNRYRNILKSIISYIVKFTVTFGILYYLLQKIELKNIFQIILSVNLFYFSIAFILTFAYWYLQSYQTGIALVHQGITLSTFRIFIINLESSFYNMCFGGVGATVSKWFKFSRLSGKRVQAFTSIAVIRLINILTLVAIGSGALLLKNPFNLPILNLLIIGILVLLSFLQIVIFNKKASIFLEKHINSLVLYIPKSMREKAIKTLNSFKDFQTLSLYKFFLILFISICLHLCANIVFFLISVSIGINLSIFVMAWITTIVLLIQIMPVSFSGLGIREGTLLFILNKYHVSGPDALAFSFLIFSLSTMIALIGGILETKNYFKQKLV